MKLLLPTIILLSLVAPRVTVAERIRVSLDVSAPETARAEIISSLSHELRKLDDIDIVDTDVELKISVVALQFSGDAGYVFSVLATAPFSDNGSNRVLKYAVMVVSHFLQAGPRLQPLAKAVVTELDSGAFEQDRKNHKSFHEVSPTSSP